MPVVMKADSPPERPMEVVELRPSERVTEVLAITGLLTEFGLPEHDGVCQG